MHAVINNVRVASQAAIFYCSVLLLFLGFLPGVDTGDSDAVHRMQASVTAAMWAGEAAAACGQAEYQPWTIFHATHICAPLLLLWQVLSPPRCLAGWPPGGSSGGLSG
jgi:hypothetical protein